MATMTKPTAKPQRRVTAKQARDLNAVEAKYAIAKAAFEKAAERREKVRARVRPRIPRGEAITVGGVLVKLTEWTMPEHTVPAGPRETWTVKRVK